MAIDRRRFLGGVAGAVAVGAAAPALAACGKTKSKNSAANNAKVTLPKYIPYSGAKPDLAGDAAGVADGYLRYPANPVQAVTSKPGSGGSVNAFTIVQGSVPPPVNRNKYWQALNSAMGIELKMSLTPNTDYPNKFATVMAGGSVPDFVQVAGPQPHLPQLLAAKFQDLSEFLSGDAVKDYPFLANMPTPSWKTTVYNGGIYGIPVPRSTVGPIMMRRDDLLKPKGLDSDPTSFDDFLKLCKELTDAKHNKWAMASTFGAMIFAQQMLGVPNSWQVKDGKFTSTLELPETKEAVAAVQKLAKAGIFHPDTFSTTINMAQLFGNGTISVHYDNYTAWSGYSRNYRTSSPGIDIGGILPPGHDGNSKPSLWTGPPSFSLTAVKKGSKSRVQELLRIANWLAAPFGTKEYLLRKYGAAGVDYTLNGTDPTLNNTGQTEVAYFTATYIADSTQVLYEPGHPEVTRKEYAYQQKAIPVATPSPTLGLYSDTDSSKSAQLVKAYTDAQHAIWQGHKSLSSWDDAVKDWRNNGGDQIRKEYEQSYAQAH